MKKLILVFVLLAASQVQASELTFTRIPLKCVDSGYLAIMEEYHAFGVVEKDDLYEKYVIEEQDTGELFFMEISEHGEACFTPLK